MNALIRPRAPMPQSLPPDAIAALVALGMVHLVERMRMVQTLPPPPQWITLSEASTESGLSVALLRRLITAGKLPAIRDRAIKVRRVDLANIANLGEMAQTGRKLKNLAAELRQRRRA